MIDPKLVLTIDGFDFNGWTSSSVIKSLNSLSGKFTFTLMDVWGDDFTDIDPGLACKVGINGKTIINGYIDSISPEIDNSNHQLEISGRDKTCDLIDCSAINKPGEWKNISFEELAKELTDPFGIKIKTEVSTGALIPKITTQSGESVFDVLKKAASLRGLILITNSSGNLLITKINQSKAFDSIVTGYNLVKAKASFDYTNRFSKYIVKGQKSADGGAWSKVANVSYGEVVDEAVERFRPRQIVAPSGATTKDCERLAVWEGTNRAAEASKITATVQGFHQSNGKLWTINESVYVNIPELRVDTDLLITEVKYIYGNQGSFAELSLRRPDIFDPKPTKKIKKKKNTWGS